MLNPWLVKMSRSFRSVAAFRLLVVGLALVESHFSLSMGKWYRPAIATPNEPIELRIWLLYVVESGNDEKPYTPLPNFSLTYELIIDKTNYVM